MVGVCTNAHSNESANDRLGQECSKDTILFGKSLREVTYEFSPQPPRELLDCQSGQMETMDLCVTDEEL